MVFAGVRRELLGRLIPCFILLVGASGCSDSTEPAPQPQPEPRAEVGFQAEQLRDVFLGLPVPGVAATVVNSGNADAFYPIRCGHAVVFTVTDEQGEILLVRDPTLGPVCPPGFLTFAPGETLETSVVISTAWNEDGTSYVTPPGQYTVRAAFRYYLSEEGEPVDLSQVVTVVLEP